MRESEPIKKSASNIYKRLESMKKTTTIYDNKTKLLRDYANACKISQVPAYMIAVGNYLEENKLLKYEKGGCRIDGLLNENDIYEVLISYVDSQDRTKPLKKTKIKREVHKGIILQPEKNLIPILEAFKKLTIEQKLETFDFNNISQVVLWLRSQGVEVKAFVKTEL